MSVRVTDPRHPLYGRRFPLVTITRIHDLGPCCVVALGAGLTRAIPVDATHLGTPAPSVHPHPLSVATAHALVAIVGDLLAERSAHDCRAAPVPTALSPDSRPAGLADDLADGLGDSAVRPGDSLDDHPDNRRDAGPRRRAHDAGAARGAHRRPLHRAARGAGASPRGGAD